MPETHDALTIPVPSEAGPGRLLVSPARGDDGSPLPQGRAVLWLGHGAGGGAGAPDLTALAEGLPGHGITVVRHEQPWVVAGRRVAPRPAALDAGWLAAAPAVAELADGRPVVAGGRSAGARVACRTAGTTGAAAVVCLAFPLHPPGRPERSRAEELLGPDVPVLVLQGTRDPFGSADEVTAAAGDTAGRIGVLPVDGADHALRTGRRAALGPAGVSDLLCRAVAEFVAAAARP
ncbi:alpha/beta family hydrolase [Kocuria flava]|uniref:alpha/beta hydrolase family protein n=1 Tax=Kocuria flava TaxID=446860 RepID=UPI002151A377|nr:alpha/beta family hydrolase [Kocuria flava]